MLNWLLFFGILVFISFIYNYSENFLTSSVEPFKGNYYNHDYTVHAFGPCDNQQKPIEEKCIVDSDCPNLGKCQGGAANKYDYLDGVPVIGQCVPVDPFTNLDDFNILMGKFIGEAHDIMERRYPHYTVESRHMSEVGGPKKNTVILIYDGSNRVIDFLAPVV